MKKLVIFYSMWLQDGKLRIFFFVILTASLRYFLLLLSAKLGYTSKVLLFQIISIQCGNLKLLLFIWSWVGQVGVRKPKITKQQFSASHILSYCCCSIKLVMWEGSLQASYNPSWQKHVPHQYCTHQYSTHVVLFQVLQVLMILLISWSSPKCHTVIWLHEFLTNGVHYSPTLQYKLSLLPRKISISQRHQSSSNPICLFCRFGN